MIQILGKKSKLVVTKIWFYLHPFLLIMSVHIQKIELSFCLPKVNYNFHHNTNIINHHIQQRQRGT